MNFNKQHGTALISALILITIIVSVTTAWISQTHFHVRKQQIINEKLQASWLADGAKILSVTALKKTSFNQTTPLIARFNNIPAPKKWRITAELTDAQAFFNLNSVTEEYMRLTYYSLLKLVVNEATINDIYYATIAWIAPNLIKQRTREFQDRYATLKQPYLPGGQKMQSLAEFKLVWGVTNKIAKKLDPYITVLPESTPININTCPAILIKSLTPNLKDSDVNKIIFARGDKGFKTDSELFAVLKELNIPVQNITTTSQYFWLRVIVTAPSQRKFFSKYLIYRPISPKNVKQVIVLQQYIS